LARGVDHTGDEYEHVQQATRRLLSDLIKHGEHTVDVNLRFQVRAGKRAGVMLLRRDARRDDMLYDFIAALRRAGTKRIQLCPAPDCDRFFVRVSRKRFCSTRCQSRTYMRKYRNGEAGGA
jgi:hypothetical protein